MNEFLNPNGVHTVYVTDYTRNDQTAGVQSHWCPTSLSEFVLQMEMWDDAAEVAQTMREGEYYHIKNARMLANPNGYLEGKVVQSKIVQLEETDAETDIHLRSLLESVDYHFIPFPQLTIAFFFSFSFYQINDCFTGERRFGQLKN